MEPLDQLKRLVVGLEARELPSDTASWLRQGIEDLLAGRAISLDHALGLTCRRGKANERPATAQRMDYRDELIREIAHHLDAPTPWAAAELIAKLLDHSAPATGNRSKVYRALKRLRQHGPPSSARQIFRVLTGGRD